MPSLRRKITLGYYAIGPLAVGVLAVLGLRAIEAENIGGDRVAEILDATMEARRFEKNFLLYRQSDDLAEARRYAGQVRAVFDGHRPVLRRFLSDEEERALSAGLHDYAGWLDRMAQGVLPERELHRQVEPELRRLGKSLVDLAEAMLARERRVAQDYLNRERATLVVFAGLLALLVVGVGRWLRGAVIRPLAVLEAEVMAIAAGGTRSITPPSQDREVISLAQAINRLLRELDERQRHLVFTEKLASLGTLVSGVAHELNNPLSNISTSCQILLEEQRVADPALVQRMLGQIDDQVARAQRIVRLLLEYARRRDMETAPVDGHDLVADTLALLKGEIPAGLTVTTAIADGLTVRADRHRLQQVLLNLIRNAIDAAGPTGTVTIGGRVAEEGGSSCTPSCPAGGGPCIEFRIEDDGPGIPADLRERVFDPFFTTKPPGQGTGLGLFIAYEIVQQHGGCIGVEDRPAPGVAVVVRLPMTENRP